MGATERQGACPVYGQRMQWRAQSSPGAKLPRQPNSRSCPERMILPVTGRRILLVEPAFPIPAKSRNHKDFLPVGLMKLGAWRKSVGDDVRLVRGLPDNPDNAHVLEGWKPNEVWVTSLFTYWSQYVCDAVDAYRKRFPRAKFVVGGIYASLMPEDCKERTRCDRVHIGVVSEAETFFPDYDLIRPFNGGMPDYQIVHLSRGCWRHCSFCGTWRIEPKFEHTDAVLPKIVGANGDIRYKKLVFYDNNLLWLPNIEGLLEELGELKREHKIQWCESQSGFDGRALLAKPQLAKLIKSAGFRNVRVAWDWGLGDAKIIENELELLGQAGYHSKDLYVFMLYNWSTHFEEMEQKRIQCWEWRVQIADCRFRPLDRTYDHYNPRASQTADEYYVHAEAKWTDAKIKQFRQNVRRQNIAVRQGYEFYSKYLETHKSAKRGEVDDSIVNPWYPGQPHPPMSLLWRSVPEATSLQPCTKAKVSNKSSKSG